MSGLFELRKLRLSPDRKSAIRRRAYDFLQRIGYQSGYVPIERVASSMQATLKYAPFEGELAGMLIRRGNEAVIAVNSSHHKNRQRFTIAHECGHLALHEGQSSFIDKSFSLFRRDQTSTEGSNLEEVEANQFASDVLMPARNILSDFSEYHVDLEDSEQIAALARKYKVSTQAMTYRVTNLLGI